MEEYIVDVFQEKNQLCFKFVITLSEFFYLLQRKMIMQDILEKEKNDAKNAVEEYVYDLRDKLCGVYEKFITEDVRILMNL